MTGKSMIHASLFTGIGGFDEAADKMGWENAFHCEWDEFCQMILKQRWPNAKSYTDIKQTDFTIWRNRINVLSAGFPCQPASHAGKRKGLEDDRWLWPETRRAYNECRPDILVLENVGGLLSILEPESLSEVERKEVELFSKDENHFNTTIERIRKRAIGTIIEQIKQDGYILPEYSDGTPIIFCIPACAVGAPHRRDRIWFTAFNADAYICSARSPGKGGETEGEGSGNYDEPEEWRKQAEQHIRPCNVLHPLADTTDIGLQSESWRIGNRNKRGILPEEQQAGSESVGGFETATNSEMPNEQRDRVCEKCREGEIRRCDCNNEKRSYPHSNDAGLERSEDDRSSGSGRERRCEQLAGHVCADWANFPTQSPIRTGDDGFPTESLRQRIREDCMGVISEEEIDKILSAASNEWCKQTIKAGGNAIVHQVALQIFKAIEAYDTRTNIAAGL